MPAPARDPSPSTAREPLEPIPLAWRAFEGPDGEWIALEAGRAGAGGGRHARAPLLHVRFARPDAPDRPLREAWVPGRALAEVPDGDLRQALASAPEPRREGKGG